MSPKNTPQPPLSPPPRAPAPSRENPWTTGLVVAVTLVGTLFLLLRSKPQSPAQSPAPTLNETSKTETASTPQTRPEFGRLRGKWLRPDGGYVLEIREVDAVGKIDAAYFNPRPINVYKAEATQDGSSTQVFVELRDTGYPGSTYRLTYVPGVDRLIGVYYQAAMQQNFPVEFERIKE